MKPTVILDFDGVIHSYTSGWKGADIIPDPPVKGAFEFINELLNQASVVIFSSRSNQKDGISAIKSWFKKHNFKNIDNLSFPDYKPPAIVSLDDRAICFSGVFPDPKELINFKTWQK